MSPPGWEWLGAAELWVRPIRTGRADVAYWKHLYESFEDVALVRTAANEGDDAILAILAPADFVTEAERILAEVIALGAPRVGAADLPAKCREDWFLEEWASAASGEDPDQASVDSSASSGGRRAKR